MDEKLLSDKSHLDGEIFSGKMRSQQTRQQREGASMTGTLRTASIETDVPGIVRLINLCDPDHPETVEDLRASFQNTAPGRIALRLVMVDGADTITGYSYIVHAAEMPAQHFYVWLAVDPQHRRRQIGTKLWRATLTFLETQRASRLTSEVLDDDPGSLSFAEGIGFRLERHRFHSRLDLTAFDEATYVPIIAALEAQGIRFCTLADLPDKPETNDRFCELNLAVVRDIPGEAWDFSAYPSFFQRNILGAAWFRRDAQILALDGETWAGFSTVRLLPERDSAYNRTTGVIRAYRGRHIALALKVLAARYARQQGARQIETDNDSLNAPMLAVNQRLGYMPISGVYHLVREIASPPKDGGA